MTTILVVDDAAAFRDAARALLDADGFDVVGCAATGADGVSLAAALSPDVVLLDLRLPDMHGTDVARQLRSGTGTARIPVVALSASTYAWNGDRLLAAGFDGYLQKPIDVRAFPEQVRGFCKGRD
jgi:two-component system cell cycle response regulator DivK